MSNLRIEMGKRMKKERKRLQLTQEQMAEKLDVTVKHYGEVERGNAGLSLENLIQISDIFDVSLDFLVRGNEENKYQINQSLYDLYVSFSPEQQKKCYEILQLLNQF